MSFEASKITLHRPLRCLNPPSTTAKEALTPACGLKLGPSATFCDKSIIN